MAICNANCTLILALVLGKCAHEPNFRTNWPLAGVANGHQRPARGRLRTAYGTRLDIRSAYANSLWHARSVGIGRGAWLGHSVGIGGRARVGQPGRIGDTRAPALLVALGQPNTALTAPV